MAIYTHKFLCIFFRSFSFITLDDKQCTLPAYYLQTIILNYSTSMNIQNSSVEDIAMIFDLYKTATDFQKKKSVVPWPDFEHALVLKEVNEKRQWKIIIDNKIACVWATTDSDPQIWQKRNKEPAIYIHRISTNPEFRGQNLVETIVKWSKKYALETGKKYIRMDTVGENMGLINHYTKCGFDFLGLSKLSDTIDLPAHYHNATVSLFQITVR